MAGYKVYLGLNGSDVQRILKAKPSIELGGNSMADKMHEEINELHLQQKETE